MWSVCGWAHVCEESARERGRGRKGGREGERETDGRTDRQTDRDRHRQTQCSLLNAQKLLSKIHRKIIESKIDENVYLGGLLGGVW